MKVNPQIRHDLPKITNGALISDIWSGYELRGFPGTFAEVNGSWTVPRVTGEANPSFSDSSTWIGLDGDGTTELVQCGTEQQAVTLRLFDTLFRITVYRAWTEFLPQQPQEKLITNFPIGPGDNIQASLLITNTGIGANLTAHYAYFLLIKWTSPTSGTATVVHTPVGNTIVLGTTAEWIMERPSICEDLNNCTALDLANFGTASMTNASANGPTPPDFGVPYYETCCGVNGLRMTMANGSNVLSTAASLSPSSATFTWHAFH